MLSLERSCLTEKSRRHHRNMQQEVYYFLAAELFCPTIDLMPVDCVKLCYAAVHCNLSWHLYIFTQNADSSFDVHLNECISFLLIHGSNRLYNFVSRSDCKI